MNLFAELESYSDYLKKYPFHEKLKINLRDYGSVEAKHKKSIYHSVNPENHEPFRAELDDLIRLHYLVTSRKVTTILEFGVGKSSIVLDDALQTNKSMYSEFVLKNLRRSNSFECHSIDNNEHWISVCKQTAQTKLVTYHYSECCISTFNDRVCTYFNNIPNICPDLIYLDGPDQFSPTGNIRGINTNQPDRVAMAADILAFEHFLLPGTLIVIDGRTANARFLKANLQRDWSYHYSEEYDQHFLELVEQPLGRYNKNQIEFCLGNEFYSRCENH